MSLPRMAAAAAPVHVRVVAVAATPRAESAYDARAPPADLT